MADIFDEVAPTPKRDIFDEVAGGAPSPISPVEGASPWAVGEGPTIKEAGKFALRTGMEGGGMALGGLGGAALGTTVAGPGPGTVGGGLLGETGGYAGGSKGADYLLGENTGSWQQKIGEGAAFSLLGAGAGSVLSSFGRGAVRSALKIPPTQVNSKTANKAVDTIIKENVRVGEGGVSKGKAIIENSEKYMDDLLAKSGGSVDATKFVDAIESMKADKRFRFGSDPAAANAVLDDVANKALMHPEVRANGTIPLAEAQQLKKGLYRELDKYYRNFGKLEPSKAMASDAELTGKATWAAEIRQQMLDSPGIPKEAADVLSRESNLVNAMGWIKRRVNVAAGMDPLTFNDVIVGGLIREGWPAALAVRFLRLPAVQSQVGIWMARSSPYAKPALQQGGIAVKNLLSGP